MDLQPPILRRHSTTFNEFLMRRNLLEEPEAFVFRSVRRNLLHDFNEVANDPLIVEQFEQQIEIVIEEMLEDVSDNEDYIIDIEEEMDYEYDTEDNIPTEIRPWNVDDEE